MRYSAGFSGVWVATGALMPFATLASPVDLAGSLGGLTVIEGVLAAVAVMAATASLLFWHKLRQRQEKPHAYLYHRGRGRLIKHPVTGKVCRIGRHHTNDIRINDPSVSRFHAEIVQNSNGTYSIHNLESKNGIRVGFRPVASSILREGDLVTIGNIRLKFTRLPTDYYADRATVMLDTLNNRFDSHRRRRERRPVTMDARIYNDDVGWVEGLVRDLSDEGAFVETARKIHARTPVDLIISFGDEEQKKWCRLAGEVVRESDDGIGISFTEINRQARATLSAIMKEDPDSDLDNVVMLPKKRTTAA